MKYQKQILEAFDYLGYSPRGDQTDYINQILIEFLDNKVKNVILSSPTGTGKSIIGAVLSEVTHKIKYPEKAVASFLITPTIVLQEQYSASFKQNSYDNKFRIIKGANNFNCAALSTPIELQTAENCAITLFKKNNIENLLEQYCDKCEFKIQREMRDKTRHLILNTAYYFVDRMYSKQPMEKRTVTVFDEAHLLNDLFVEHNAIYFSEKRIKKFIEEISSSLELGNTDIYKTLKKINDDLISSKITDITYKTYLKELHEVYQNVSETSKREAERNIRDQVKYLQLWKLSKKYFNLGCKIDDLLLFNYPHVFEYKSKEKKQLEHEVIIKPIFIGEMFDALDNAEHNLLMSGTITKNYINTTMKLSGKTKYIRLPNQFPPENKKIIFFKPMSLNYNSMKNPDIIKKLCDNVFEIVKFHTTRKEHGLILTPSFDVTENISENLNIKDLVIFEHRRGEKLAYILQDFKNNTSPSVLITPSAFEGIDLSDDLCRYQIIVKSPYASLGDKRMKYILDNHQEIYSLNTLQKIVQGAGRSVRNAEDWAWTYILDSSAVRLWSGENEWKSEFSVSYSSFLDK